MPEPIRLSPVLLDGHLVYLALCPDPAELANFVDWLPGEVDNDMHRSVFGVAMSCHVWAAHTSVTLEELHALMLEGAHGAGCDLVFSAEPVAKAIVCGCGEHCAAVADSCGICLDGKPVGVVDGIPACDRCVSASKEAAATADTEPPPPIDDDVPSFLGAMREGLGS